MTPSHGEGPVVVTGGAGAIGLFLVRSLLSDGLDVRVIDNFSSSRRESLAVFDKNRHFSLLPEDLRHADAIRPAFRGAESVWHFAANPDIRLGTREPRTDLEHGTLATFHVLEAARREGVRRVFFSSSSVVYGYPTVFPTPEEYGPLLPESQYGASKLGAEALASAFAHNYGMQAYLYRFANIIGPGMTHGVLFDFFEKLKATPERLEVLGDGNQSKSYLRVEECVDAMRFVADHARETVNVYNLGAADRISVRAIAEMVVRAHGGTARVEFTGGDRGWTGDIPQQLLAVAKVAQLGWRAKRSSAQAVEETIRDLVRERGL